MSPSRGMPRWPLFLIASPAAVAVWSGWVGLGGMCGFGVIHPLPGIWDALRLNTAITLPVGVEAYGAYALGAWLTPGTPDRARTFARRSAIGALVLGMAGQVIYHLLAAAGAVRAPWPVVVVVSCMPVITLGFGAALTHLLRVAAPGPAMSPWPRPAPVIAAPVATTVTGQPDGHEAATGRLASPAITVANDRPRQVATKRPKAGQKRGNDRPSGNARQLAVAALRDQPDMTMTNLAAAIGRSERTARRIRSAMANGHTPEGEIQ